MYPNFSYILHAITGIGPDNALSIIQTFGLMLAIAIISSGYFLLLELRRKEQEGLMLPVSATIITGAAPSTSEVAWNGLLGFIIGFKGLFALQHMEMLQADPGGVLLSGQGSMAGGILGLLLMGGWKGWKRHTYKGKVEEKKVMVYPHERVWDIAMIAGVSGVIGSKLFSILEDPAALMADPMGQIFSGSGLNFLGGLILGFAGVFTYIRLKKIDGIHLLDAAVPALIVGYAVGRIGCQLSGDGDWGIVHATPVPGWWFLPEWIWAFDYPHNVLNEGIPIEGCEWKYCHILPEKVYPTPFYETMIGLLMLGIVWLLRRHIRIAGMMFFLYLMMTSTSRFFIEKIRVNDKHSILGMSMTQAEALSILLFIIGLGGMLWLLWRNKGTRNP